MLLNKASARRLVEKTLGSRGFTLIEIILVVVIFSVVIVLAVPNLGSTYSSMLMKKQAEDIVYLMRYAQSRAIIKSVFVRLIFDADYTKYRLLQSRSEDEDVDIDDIVFVPFSGRFSRSHKIPNDINVESDSQEINFYPDGKIDKSNIGICREEKCYTVSTEKQRGHVLLLREF